MKVRILLISIFLGIFIFAQTQPAKAYTKSISGDPIGLIFGLFNVTYEFQTGPQNSMTIFGNYLFPTGWTALGLGASYRWYIVKEKKKKIIEGFSFGPKAMFSYWGSDVDDGGIGFSIGGEAAYKWVFGGFVVEPIVNLMIPVVKYYGNSVYFGLGVNLGYAW
jgi:hypothetical protein